MIDELHVQPPSGGKLGPGKGGDFWRARRAVSKVGSVVALHTPSFCLLFLGFFSSLFSSKQSGLLARRASGEWGERHGAMGPFFSAAAFQ